MRIRIFALVLGAASAITLSSVAPALGDGDDYTADDEADDEEEDSEGGIIWHYDRSGFYFIAQGANYIGTFRGNPTSSISTSTDDSFGAKGAIGYRINPHVAAEVQFDWVQGFNANVNGSGKNFNGGGITAQVKGYPLTGRFQPFGMLGLGVAGFEIRHTKETRFKSYQADLMLRFGVGMNYWFTEKVGMVLDAGYSWPTGASGDLDDLDYASFGWGFIIRIGRD